MTQFVGDTAATFKPEYGNISTAGIGAIQRGLLGLEEQGGGSFFGEPTLDLSHLMQTDSAGKEIINILAAEKLMQSPALSSDERSVVIKQSLLCGHYEKKVDRESAHEH